MEFDKYLSKLPLELGIIGKEFGLQFLKLYAYYAYFDGDNINTELLNDSCFYSRERKYNIDGVFINKSLEDDAIECVFSMPIKSGNFNLTESKEAVEYIYASLYDAIKNKSFLSEQQQVIVNALNDYEIDKIIIRIITDFVPSDEEGFNIRKSIESKNGKIGKYEYASTISFGDDVKSIIDSNIAPFDCVDAGYLKVDNANNILKFNESSFICNISAKSLKELWTKEGKKGLLAMNLRYHVKGPNVDDKIEESILNDSKDFWYLNNGIIIVCNDFNFVNNELRLKDFSIVNGGQTSKIIGETPINEDFYISCKVIKNVYTDSKDKNYFISKVAEASNTQKPIKPKDLIANRVEQRELKESLLKSNIFVEIKRGEKAGSGNFSEPWQKTKNNELAQDLYSFVFLQPGPARNSVSQILINKDKYNTIFVKHNFSAEFLKSLLFIEKSFKYYQKNTSKSELYDSTSKGLIKNGLYYVLATIGYFLKHYYCSDFTTQIEKTLNHEQKNEIYSKEPAFDFNFIKNEETFKEFRDKSVKLFDFIIDVIKTAYQTAKDANPNVTYANWTKQNTGFKSIKRNIDYHLFNLKERTEVDYVGGFFADLTEEQSASNLDYYYSNYKKAFNEKSEKEKANQTESKKIWDALLLYRLETSKNRKIKENKVLTDKEINEIASKQPENKEELEKLVRPEVIVYSCDEILKIVKNNKY